MRWEECFTAAWTALTPPNAPEISPNTFLLNILSPTVSNVVSAINIVPVRMH